MPRRSDYRSQALSLSRVREAITAYAHARALGCPLNLALDIHWHWTRFATEGIWNRRKAVPALLQSLHHWLAYNDVGFHCIAVREAPPLSNKGEHPHLLIHVPPNLQAAFLDHNRSFLPGNKRLQKRALEWATTYNDGKLAYMLKGCTPHAREHIAAMFETDYERQHFLAGTTDKTRQGIIYGKRLLISQGLGPRARRSASNDNANARIRSSQRQPANVRF